MNDETPKTRLWKRLLHRPGWLIALAVCLLLSAVLVPFGWRYYRTWQLVAGIEAHGGRVGFNQGGPQWLRDVVGDEWMKPFDAPEQVSWKKPRTSGAWTLPSISGVGSGPPKEKLTDAVFIRYVVPLDDLHGIRTVVIDRSNLTHRSFKELAQFEHLEVLSLSDKAFDDEALGHFSMSFNLQKLFLSGTSISDEGLQHLYWLENLKVVSLYDTNVTSQAEWRLQRRLSSRFKLDE
ncbi:hypothetical protein Mal52_48740 [Symmachiella dynata]|uniref:Leucine Rich repeats (2 copies) n=1 Tax=Symmachiella dynata TaxID=2527995 RepID=A0A517ZV84_9PLAN|nr:hypothetical protein [Symmachiella dynata]QDU46355.1 hypothetical protein Mal52_48740 [Symmachiella dynata]